MEKFGKRRSPEVRKSNENLRRALIAAGAILASTPAQADEVRPQSSIIQPVRIKTIPMLPNSASILDAHGFNRSGDAKALDTVVKRAFQESLPAAVPLPREKPEELKLRQQGESLLEKIHQRKATLEEILAAESMISVGAIPLKMQIDILQSGLQPGGYMLKELHNNNLSEQRFSDIIKLVNFVSVRFTEQFQNHPDDPELKNYFDIDSFRKASRYAWYEYEDDKKKPGIEHKFCNGNLSRVEGDIYFVTNDHCVKDTKEAVKFRRDSKGDIAAMYISPQEYKEWSIDDPSKLPQLTTASSLEELSGQLVVSLSYRLGPEKKMIEYPHFSIAFPLAGRIEMVKPPEEGMVTKYIKAQKEGDPDEVQIRAQGSSGSIAAIPGQNITIGTLTAVKIIRDNCAKLCYAISSLGNPATPRHLIEKDQAERASGANLKNIQARSQ